MLVNDPFSFLYIATTIYFLTMGLMISIYVWILRHMKLNSFRAADAQRITEGRRQRREFRLYSRIIILIVVLFVLGVPYCTFFFVSVSHGFAPPPPYADRISILCLAVGHSVDMVLSLMFTDDVRKIFLTTLRGAHPNTRTSRVQPAAAITMRADTTV